MVCLRMRLISEIWGFAPCEISAKGRCEILNGEADQSEMWPTGHVKDGGLLTQRRMAAEAAK